MAPRSPRLAQQLTAPRRVLLRAVVHPKLPRFCCILGWLPTSPIWPVPSITPKIASADTKALSANCATTSAMGMATPAEPDIVSLGSCSPWQVCLQVFGVVFLLVITAHSVFDPALCGRVA